MKRSVLLALFIPSLVSFETPAFAQRVVRLGTLAPDGSAWHQEMQRMRADIQQSTGGNVVIRIYAGGVVGNEDEMIRMMRIGQLQAAAISNAGLAQIDSGAWVISIPLMYESYDEWNYVRQQINPILKQRFREKGFVVLTWSDLGWIHFFTTQPLRRPDELKRMKLATSATESEAVQIFKWAGFNPVPIQTMDVMTGLQTGMVDALYLPIIYAEGSQFFRYARNMTDLRWAPLQGAIVIHESSWNRLTPTQQKVVRTAAQRTGRELRRFAGELETRSLAAMKRRGLKVWDVDEAASNEWQSVAISTYPRIRERVVPEDLFDRALELRDEYRARQRTSP